MEHRTRLAAQARLWAREVWLIFRLVLDPYRGHLHQEVREVRELRRHMLDNQPRPREDRTMTDTTPHEWMVPAYIPVPAGQDPAALIGQKITVPEGTRAIPGEVFCRAHGGSPGHNPCPLPAA